MSHCTQKSSSLSLSQLSFLSFHRRQEVKAEARDRKKRPQIDSVSVTCNGCVGIATVWRWMPSRRPKKTRRGRVFPPRSVVISVFFVVSMAFIWRSHGHDVCSIRPLDFFHAPWQRIIEPDLERITAPLKVKSLQPSSTIFNPSILLQFCFSFFFQSQVLLLLDFAEVRRWLRHTRGKNEQFAFEQPCYNLTYRTYRRLINDL